MNNTGVSRRIDELGRIVIPKEIRKNLEIRNGDIMDISIDENKIILTKQHLKNDIALLSNKLINIINQIYKINIFVCDYDKIISTSYDYNNLLNEKITKELINLIEDRKIYISEDKEQIILNSCEIYGYNMFVPIIVDTDSVGLIIINKDEPISLEEQNIIKMMELIISEKLNIC